MCFDFQLMSFEKEAADWMCLISEGSEFHCVVCNMMLNGSV